MTSTTNVSTTTVNPFEKNDIFRKRLNSKASQVMMQEFKITSDETGVNYSLAIVPLGETEATRNCIKSKKRFMISGKNKVSCEHATRDLISLDLQGNKEFVFKYVYAYYKERTKLFVAMPDEHGNTEYVEVGTGKAFKGDEGSLVEYQMLGNAPSGTRKVKALAYATAKGVDDFLNTVTDGMYNLSLGRELSVEAYTKLVARFFQWTAPNAIIGTVSNYGTFFGKFANGLVDGAAFLDAACACRGANSKLGLSGRLAYTETDLLGHYWQVRVASTKVKADIVGMKTFMPLLLSSIGGVDNVIEISVDDKEAIEIYKTALSGQRTAYDGKIVVIGKLSELEFVSDMNGYKGTFEPKAEMALRVLDMTNPKRALNLRKGAKTSMQMINSIAYSNPEKLVAMLKSLLDSEIEEEMAALSRNANIFSLNQACKNMHAAAIVDSIAPAYAASNIRLLTKKTEDLLKTFSKKLEKLSFKVDGNFSRLMADPSSLAGIKLLDIDEAFMPGAKEYFEGLELSGFTKEERVNIANMNVSMFKYPKMGAFEFGLLKAVSLKEIFTRLSKKVAAGEIGYKESVSIRSYYKDLKPGCFVVAAEKILADKLAGMDFDWDGATIVLDPKFNALLPKEDVVVKIEQPKASLEGIVKVDRSTIYDSFVRMMVSPNESIGVITRNLGVAQGFLAKLRSGYQLRTTKSQVIKTLRSMVGDDLCVEGAPYSRLKSKEEEVICQYGDNKIFKIIEVDSQAIIDCMESIKVCDFTVTENQIAILEDLEVIYRYYQECTIDSPKTGLFVEILLDPSKEFQNVVNNPVVLDIDWNKVDDMNFVFDNNGKLHESSKKEAFEDILFIKRGEYGNSIIEALAKNYAGIGAKVAEFFRKESVAISNALNYSEKAGKYIASKQIMVQANLQYGDIVKLYLEDLALAEEDDDALDLAREIYLSRIKALRSTVRSATSNLNSIERAYCAMAVSSFNKIDSKNVELKDTRGSFADVVLPEEILAYVQANQAWYVDVKVEGTVTGKVMNFVDGVCEDATLVIDGEDDYSWLSDWNTGEFKISKVEGVYRAKKRLDFFGEELMLNNGIKAGDTITLNNGIEENENAVTREAISGTFEIREFNGKLYASELISDVLKKSYEGSIAKDSNETLVRVKFTKEIPYEVALANLLGADDIIISARGNDYGIYSNNIKLAGIDCNTAFATYLDGRQGTISQVMSSNVKNATILVAFK